MRLRVQPGGAVVLTVPVATTRSVVDEFLRARARWLADAVKRMMQFQVLPVSGRRDYFRHKENARAFIEERIAHWNQFYKFPHGRIAIKNTRRTWGSCSAKRNLNFSYKLLFLPREIADYVVVHELCHLKEHNHGRAFWALVALVLPNYLTLRLELKRYVPRG